jgi:hypothetical protein
VSGPVPDGETLRRATSLMLSTPRASTGRPAWTEVWFAWSEEALHFLAHARDDGRGTAWYRHLVAAGETRARVGGFTSVVRHDPFPPGTDALGLVLELFEAKYGAAAVGQWYRPTARIPVRARLVDTGES